MTQQTQDIQQTVAAVLDEAAATAEQAPQVPSGPPGPPVPSGPNAPKTAAKKRKAKKRVKRIIALIVALALLAGGSWAVWYFIFRTTVEQGELLTDTVKLGTIQSKVEGSGNAVARDIAAISVNNSGTVREVYVSAGDTVMEGDPLYSIYSPAAEQAVRDAEKAVEDAQYAIPDAMNAVADAQDTLAQAQEALAQVPQENQEKLEEARQAVADAQQGVVDAQQGVADAQQGVQDAQEALAERQAELAKLQSGVAELTLTAPFAGKLISVEDITVGSKLEAGAAVATLANTQVMKLSLYFSYAYVDDIYAGQRAEVSVPDMTLTCPGTVSAVNRINLVSPEGGILFEAVIDVSNPGALTEGQTATAVLQAADGSEIFPYESGKLAYGETVKLTTAQSGTVTSKALLQYADVTKGQVLLVQASDDVDGLIAAKQKEIRDAQRAVESAQKGVETARKAVETAQKAVEAAQKGIPEAQRAGEQALKSAQRAVRDAQRAVDQANRNVETAQSAVPDAQEALAKAQEDLAALDATSPISGTVDSCAITPGQEVKQGDSVMTISNTSQMAVEIRVNDQNIGFVKLGMTVELKDNSDNMWMGTVTKIDTNPSQDGMGSGSSNYPVTLTVDNFDGTLSSGVWLQYSFVASQVDSCLVVPTQAVKSTMDEEGNDITVVFIQADSRPDNAVTMPEQSPDMPKKYPTEEDGFYAVPVTTGLNDTYNVEIKSGLNADDVVFTNYLSASGNNWGVMYG